MSRATIRYAKTRRVCPIRWVRSIACASTVGGVVSVRGPEQELENLTVLGIGELLDFGRREILGLNSSPRAGLLSLPNADLQMSDAARPRLRHVDPVETLFLRERTRVRPGIDGTDEFPPRRRTRLALRPWNRDLWIVVFVQIEIARFRTPLGNQFDGGTLGGGGEMPLSLGDDERRPNVLAERAGVEVRAGAADEEGTVREFQRHPVDLPPATDASTKASVPSWIVTQPLSAYSAPRNFALLGNSSQKCSVNRTASCAIRELLERAHRNFKSDRLATARTTATIQNRSVIFVSAIPPNWKW